MLQPFLDRSARRAPRGHGVAPLAYAASVPSRAHGGANARTSGARMASASGVLWACAASKAEIHKGWGAATLEALGDSSDTVSSSPGKPYGVTQPQATWLIATPRVGLSPFVSPGSHVLRQTSHSSPPGCDVLHRVCPASAINGSDSSSL